MTRDWAALGETTGPRAKSQTIYVSDEEREDHGLAEKVLDRH